MPRLPGSSDPNLRRGAGAVERGGLENRCARERTEGSNPSLSAITKGPGFPGPFVMGQRER